jgi:hypothetical protein
MPRSPYKKSELPNNRTGPRFFVLNQEWLYNRFVYLLMVHRGYEKLLCDNEEKLNQSNRNMSKSVCLRGKDLFGIIYPLIILKQIFS